MRIRLIIFILLLSFGESQGQKTYHFRPSYDIPAMVLGSGALVTSHFLEKRIQPLSDQQISNLSPPNRLDGNWQFDVFKEGYHKGSDIVFYGFAISGLVAHTFWGDKSDKIDILLIAAEGIMINHSITDAFKLGFRRARPFLHAQPGLYDRSNPDSRLSFYSGHTSNSAYLSFFTASVLREKNIIRGKWVWFAASAVPVIMGTLRMAAGKHYFTDVLTGTMMGAGMGLLIPILHQVRE